MYPKREIINGKLNCCKCKLNKNPEEFGEDKSTYSGYRSNCKVCRRKTRSKTNKYKSNVKGMTGIFRYICPQCEKGFNTKNPNKVFCEVKCTKRNWYENNQMR